MPGYYHGNTMPTLTFKVSPEFKARLTRAARKRRVSVSELVRVSVEKELPEDGKGWLLGRLKKYSLGRSTYDPSQPVIAEEDWDMLKE